MHALEGSSLGSRCRRTCSIASIMPSCGIFVYNDSTSSKASNKVLSGSRSARGLMNSTKVDEGAVTASMPATIGRPGGSVSFASRSQMICLYLVPWIVHSILTSLSAPAPENHPHSMMLHGRYGVRWVMSLFLKTGFHLATSIKPRLVRCCRYYCPSGRLSHLNQGTL